MAVTDGQADRLLRLPLWVGLEPQLDGVIDQLHASLAAVTQAL
jgi:hypothetical protein